MPSHDATRAFKLFFGPERVEPRPVYGDKAPHETRLSSPLRNCKRQIGGLVAMRDENLVRLGLALLRRDQVYLLTIARLTRRIVQIVILPHPRWNTGREASEINLCVCVNFKTTPHSTTALMRARPRGGALT